jgi:hypothetical protein
MQSETTLRNLTRLSRSTLSLSTLGSRPKDLSQAAIHLFQIDKAQRQQYSAFDVGRSMFDVQSVRSSGQAEFHTSKYQILTPETKEQN